MAAMRLFVSLAIVSAMAQAAVGVNHQVGPSGTWQLGSNFQQWAASQTFSVGDNLVFQYGGLHDVLEVSKADYDSCQTSNPIETHTDGNTIIPLTSPGNRYFICGTSGHCSGGMKLQVDTVAAAAAPSAPSRSPISSKSPPPSPPKVSPARSPSPSPKLQSPSKSPSSSPPATSPSPSPPEAAGTTPSTSAPQPPPSAAAYMGGRKVELGILGLAVGMVAIMPIAFF